MAGAGREIETDGMIRLPFRLGSDTSDTGIKLFS